MPWMLSDALQRLLRFLFGGIFSYSYQLPIIFSSYISLVSMLLAFSQVTKDSLVIIYISLISCFRCRMSGYLWNLLHFSGFYHTMMSRTRFLEFLSPVLFFSSFFSYFRTFLLPSLNTCILIKLRSKWEATVKGFYLLLNIQKHLQLFCFHPSIYWLNLYRSEGMNAKWLYLLLYSTALRTVMLSPCATIIIT